MLACIGNKTVIHQLYYYFLFCVQGSIVQLQTLVERIIKL